MSAPVTPTAARSTARLVIGLLVALALLPPLLVGAAGWSLERAAAREQAGAAAFALGRAGAPREASQMHTPGGWVALLDAQGRVATEAGLHPPWPAVGWATVLEAPDAEVAMVQVVRGLRPTLWAAVLAALGSAAVALGLWWKIFHRPVSRLQQAEVRIRRHARLDPLTGLLNRDGLNLRIASALERAAPRGATLGLLVLDLDRFNLVNGTLGEAAGDTLLRAAADRLRGVVRGSDALARIGADQFVVVVEGISGAPVLAAMANNLLRAFEPPFACEGHELQLSFSAGGVLTSETTHSADDLLRRAGAAMRAAKTAGGARFSLFEAAMDSGVQQRLELDLRLRRALAAGQFFLLYQPIVEPREGRTVAVEALLRWAAPDRGLVSPADFIPVLEETGLVVSVGHWVLHEACRRAAAWHREGHRGLVLSVNISPRQFAEADFVERVRGTLLTTGFPAALLQLEVTEGLLLEPTPEALRRIGELAALGVRLTVDDFGMGYSSLAYLKRFPLHGLKIDQFFVRDIAAHPQDLAIVRAIVDLGHSLGLAVTAEGVETEAQREALRRVGCDALQGYLFARPMAPDTLALGDAAAAVGVPPTAPPALAAPALPQSAELAAARPAAPAAAVGSSRASGLSRRSRPSRTR